MRIIWKIQKKGKLVTLTLLKNVVDYWDFKTLYPRKNKSDTYIPDVALLVVRYFSQVQIQW